MGQNPAGRHAEISGAGIAGLTTACVLAQRGWSVRVHERTGELREMGAGIYLKINSLQVLEEIGVLDELESGGTLLKKGYITDRAGETIAHRVMKSTETVIVHRGLLHRTLAQKALDLGVRVETSSTVSGAATEGKLLFANGREATADLVIGADGFRSAVRDSVGLLDSLAPMREGAIRILVPRKPSEREGLTTEQWSGDCRLGIVACSREQLYLYLIGPAKHTRASAIPVDVDFWCERFPQEADVLRRIDPLAGRHDQFMSARVNSWSAGRVAIIGDAVHSQPPNLGQGAGLAIANAGALGAALDASSDLSEALKKWEAERRPVTEEVQRWSYYYGVIFYALLPAGAIGESLRCWLMGFLHRMATTGRKLAWVNRGGHHPGEVILPRWETKTESMIKGNEYAGS